MTDTYIYTNDVLPSLTGAILLTILGLFSWRRRSLPAALPLAIGSLFGVLWMLGIAFETAAVAPAARLAWHKFQAAWQLPTATAMTCFALEYAAPGRWLNRRNLTLLALPPLLLMLLITTNNAQFMWRRLEIAPDGSLVRYFNTPAAILLVYGVGLVLLNVTAFLWLFVRSPQHRWPAALMLFGDIAARSLYGLYQLGVRPVPSLTLLDSFVVALLLDWNLYVIALFGFRIFDPLPAARRMAIEQMQEGLLVFGVDWRVVSLNPAAGAMLSTLASRARGKTLAEVLPAFPDLNVRLNDTLAEINPLEISLGTGPDARRYTLTTSLLKDFRGPPVGHVLLLRDVTEQRRAQAQILEQQMAVAILAERERMARELHDSLGQVLGYIKMQAQAARSLLAQEHRAEADSCLAQLASVTQDLHADVREYISGASAVSPIERGFSAALRDYLARFRQNYQIRTELEMAPEITDAHFEPTVAVQLLRIIQEALTNARKHAHASQIRISLIARDGTAEVTIADDGQGFDPGQADGGGFGLRFMRERAEGVRGGLRVQSAPGRGTQVVVDVPLRRDDKP